MEHFTEQPESRVFISTDAGSTGLNLQVASILINLDLPWNPAVLEQRIARIYRIGQQRNIQVINLVTPASIEERMLSTLDFKASLFEGILDNGEDSIFLEDSKLEKIVENISPFVETPADATGQTPAEEVIRQEEKEEPAEKNPSEMETPAGEESVQPGLSPVSEEDTVAQEPRETAPEDLLRQGMSFFSGLARTLKSPEATRQLVDSLVEEDRESGRTTLRIPVPDKESVTDLLSLLGKMFAK